MSSKLWTTDNEPLSSGKSCTKTERIMNGLVRISFLPKKSNKKFQSPLFRNSRKLNIAWRHLWICVVYCNVRAKIKILAHYEPIQVVLKVINTVLFNAWNAAILYCLLSFYHISANSTIPFINFFSHCIVW